MADTEILFNLGRLVGMLQGKNLLNTADFKFAEDTLIQVQEMISNGINNSTNTIDI